MSREWRQVAVTDHAGTLRRRALCRVAGALLPPVIEALILTLLFECRILLKGILSEIESLVGELPLLVRWRASPSNSQTIIQVRVELNCSLEHTPQFELKLKTKD